MPHSMDVLRLDLDRQAATPLADQIRLSITRAILDRSLAPGARLPSWRDLSVQLGVARGTVKLAYERLADELLVVASGPAGTRVARQVPAAAKPDTGAVEPPLPRMFQEFASVPLTFQPGVPAQDAFPFKLWSRIAVRTARSAAAAPVGYPDPRGDPELRAAIASYLAVSRGLVCMPSQVIVTNGFAGAVGLVGHALGLAGKTAWMEEPGFPITRTALGLAGMTVVPVPVDREGLDISTGIDRASGAALAVVTPGQHAPLGMSLSAPRRRALLDWAADAGAWILEDDYLSELQLRGRAPPALAALDRAGRVLHAGTFSKTITPALRLGFLVVPAAVASRFGEVAACLAPAPASAIQRPVAAFLDGGHYLRHLRRMKRLYRSRREALAAALRCSGLMPSDLDVMAGLAVLIRLASGADDAAVAREALGSGLAPVPLSPWYADPGTALPGLLLGATNISLPRLDADCLRLGTLIRQGGKA